MIIFFKEFLEKVKNYFVSRDEVSKKFKSYVYTCMTMLILGNILFLIKELFTDPGHYLLFILRGVPIILTLVFIRISKKQPNILKYSTLIINLLCGVGIMVVALWTQSSDNTPSCEGVILYYCAAGLCMGPCFFEVIGQLLGLANVVTFSIFFHYLGHMPFCLGYDPSLGYSILSGRCILAGVFIYVLGIVFSISMFGAHHRMLLKERELKKTLDTDSLTGVYNRHWINKHPPVSNCIIGIIDCDKFKYINDTYGHSVGDNVLRSNAKIIKGMLDDGEYIARYGGDEFILILKPDRNTSIFYDTVNMKLDEYYSNLSYKSTVSIGFAYVKNQMTVEESLKLADKYLYELKYLKKAKEVLCD